MQRLILLSHKIRDRVFIWIATARCSILAYLHPDRGTGMDGGSSEGSEARFAAYVEALGVVLGHADRQQPMHDYCLGLLMPIDRKSVEPMAAVTAPGQVAAKHQSLLHFVGNAPWSDAAMLGKVAELVLPAIERSGPIEAWIIDDTGFPKKGRHSVGVTRQYCGQLGKQDNCQVAVTLSLANHDASLPLAYRLYLPEDWAKDQVRRDRARVPQTIAFQTKPEIAFEQIKAARGAGLPQGVVLMDAGYGNDTGLRTDISSLGLRYVAGIGPKTVRILKCSVREIWGWEGGGTLRFSNATTLILERQPHPEQGFRACLGIVPRVRPFGAD